MEEGGEALVARPPRGREEEGEGPRGGQGEGEGGRALEPGPAPGEPAGQGEGPEGGQKPEAGMPGTGAGATLVVDVTPEDAPRIVILQMTRTSGGDEPVAEQALIDFLEPFHVGTKR